MVTLSVKLGGAVPAEVQYSASIPFLTVWLFRKAPCPVPGKLGEKGQVVPPFLASGRAFLVMSTEQTVQSGVDWLQTQIVSRVWMIQKALPSCLGGQRHFRRAQEKNRGCYCYWGTSILTKVSKRLSRSFANTQCFNGYTWITLNFKTRFCRISNATNN